MKDVPRCCGDKMKKVVETTEFIEYICSKCSDTIYVKKEARPILLDD